MALCAFPALLSVPPPQPYPGCLEIAFLPTSTGNYHAKCEPPGMSPQPTQIAISKPHFSLAAVPCTLVTLVMLWEGGGGVHICVSVYMFTYVWKSIAFPQLFSSFYWICNSPVLLFWPGWSPREPPAPLSRCLDYRHTRPFYWCLANTVPSEPSPQACNVFVSSLWALHYHIVC